MTLLRSIVLVASLSVLMGSTIAQTGQAIGEWRDHFPYRNAIAVAEGGDHVYCASVNGMFRYTIQGGEIARLTKVNALSDVGIKGIAWNGDLGSLLVYYSNGNLDLVQGDRSYNMADIKRSNILGNKTVYSATMQGDLAYLGCGFGIVVVDMRRREVRETWLIGPGGAQVQVNGIAFLGDSIYAATNSGLISAYRFAPNLAAFSNWSRRNDLPSAVVNGPFNEVVSFGGELILNYNAGLDVPDTLLVLGGTGTFERFEPLYGKKNLSLDVSPNGELLTIAHEWDIHRYDLDLTEVSFQYEYEQGPVRPSRAVGSRFGYIWVADKDRGLVKATGFTNGNTILVNGPLNASAYRMDMSDGALYVATGAVEGNWSNKFRKDGVHHFMNGTWRSSTIENEPLMEGANDHGEALTDIMAVVVDPDDPDHAWAGSWDDGLLEFRGRQPIALYNALNSILQNEINGPPNKLNVAGLDYDRDGNLWMTNGNTNAPIVVRKKNGDWHAYNPGSVLNGNQLMSDIVVATNGYKWVVRPRTSGLLVFNDGGTIADTGDDQYKVLNNQPGTGGLPSNDVFSVAEDLDQQVWVGTNKGVAVFYSPEAIFSDGDYDAQQILIEQDGNIQILLETEAVSVIKIDGANRKWIGTETSGVFLLSADGRTQIHHFTVENSPLPSNTIFTIAIDELSGEVFFGTDAGIISYRSDATGGENENECATVFPNPVKAEHNGPIAITGLVRDSEVKIADIAGNLVYRTTSLGGQAIWPGTDMAGNAIATGVYLILATDRFGSSKCNTKVLVVR